MTLRVLFVVALLSVAVWLVTGDSTSLTDHADASHRPEVLGVEDPAPSPAEPPRVSTAPFAEPPVEPAPAADSPGGGSAPDPPKDDLTALSSQQVGTIARLLDVSQAKVVGLDPEIQDRIADAFDSLMDPVRRAGRAFYQRASDYAREEIRMGRFEEINRGPGRSVSFAPTEPQFPGQHVESITNYDQERDWTVSRIVRINPGDDPELDVARTKRDAEWDAARRAVRDIINSKE